MIMLQRLASRFVHPDSGFPIGASTPAVIEQGRKFHGLTLLPEL
jgi:hypothetical protein